MKKGGGLCDKIESEVYNLLSAHKIFIKPQETIFAETNFTIIKSTPTLKLEIFDHISSGWLNTEFHRLIVIKPGTISPNVFGRVFVKRSVHNKTSSCRKFTFFKI